MESTNKSKPPYLLLLLGILAVSTAAILIKLALPFASPIAIAFHRLAFSAAIAIAIFLFTKRDQRLQIDRKQLGLLILSGILLAAHFATWTYSLDLVSVNITIMGGHPIAAGS